MGVPAFFRWLTKKYPSIIVNCIEENSSTDAQGIYHPLDETRPNPNGIEVGILPILPTDVFRFFSISSIICIWI